MSGRGIIAQEPDQVCELCGKIDECRPYGPKDEEICFDCATSTPEDPDGGLPLPVEDKKVA